MGKKLFKEWVDLTYTKLTSSSVCYDKYAEAILCESCKNRHCFLYFTATGKFVCLGCTNSPFIETEQKWKESDDKLEAEAEHKRLLKVNEETSLRPKGLAEKCLEEQHNLKKEYQEKMLNYKQQPEYLKCPECGCEEFGFNFRGFNTECAYYTHITTKGIRTTLLSCDNRYTCTNCKTTLKYQSAQSGQMVKIKSEGKNAML